MNREDIPENQSKWVGNVNSNGVSSLIIELNQPTEINKFVAYFDKIQNGKIENYKVCVQNDLNKGNDWITVYQSQQGQNKNIKGKQEIYLDKTYLANKVKLIIKPKGNKKMVSLYEFELYNDPNFVQVKEIAKNLAVKPITIKDKRYILPRNEKSDKVDISLVGSDYEQVINSDLTISHPLVDKEVVVSFKVTNKKNTQEATSEEFKVIVPGKYDKENSHNEKPKVIPELQEWFGLDGDFVISDKSRIIVDSSCDDKYMDMAKEFAKDYEDITRKSIVVKEGNNPLKSDFYFKPSKEKFDKESYEMNVNDYTTILSSDKIGAYWATRTILQILKQNGTSIPKGIVKDYPKYKVRGVMIDVGRQPATLYFLKDWVKQMSWYKMNDLQLHLSDVSFGHDYEGFRLESDIPNLSSKDLVYSKEDFHNFLLFSKSIGVNIVPEFDTPGHAGAFVNARPDLQRPGSKDEPLFRDLWAFNMHDYLDVKNPQTLEFVKSVFDQYMQKHNSVFLDDTIVHIGTDEYKGATQEEKEAFRKYQDELLKYIRDDKHKTPRVWGSQTENDGDTPITVDGVQMNLWYNNYSDPIEMFNLGYDVINTTDEDLYIVPSSGGYNDYLDHDKIYNRWVPNICTDKYNPEQLPVSSPQILGGTYALWNDMSGPRRDAGVSDMEEFDRLFDILPIFSTKVWGDAKDYTLDEIEKLSEITDTAPNSNPTYKVPTKEDRILDYSFDSPENLKDNSSNKYDILESINAKFEDTKYSQVLTLQGGQSYVSTPLQDLKYGSTIDFWVKKDSTDSNEEQILFESEKGSVKAVQKGTGKFGFSRGCRDYSFNYTLPNKKWTHITLVTELGKTILYVNGTKVDTLERIGKGDSAKGKFATLIMPLERIGSKTNAFRGQIDNVKIFNSIKSENAIKDPVFPNQAISTVITKEAAPEVEKTTPENGAKEVSRKGNVIVSFTKDVTLAKSENVVLKDSEGKKVDVEVKADGKTLTIDPKEDLDYNKEYTLTVKPDAIVDAKGNNLAKDYEVTFTTEKDKVALEISESNIVNEQVGIELNPTIEVTFNENIVAGEKFTKIKLVDEKGNKVNVETKVEGKKLVVKPETLEDTTKYILTIPKASVKDTVGNELKEEKNIRFKTVEVAPQVENITPVNESREIKIKSNVNKNETISQLKQETSVKNKTKEIKSTGVYISQDNEKSTKNLETSKDDKNQNSSEESDENSSENKNEETEVKAKENVKEDKTKSKAEEKSKDIKKEVSNKRVPLYAKLIIGIALLAGVVFIVLRKIKNI